MGDGTKITRGKVDKDTKKAEAGDAIDNGLKNEVFSQISDKGILVRIKTDEDKKIITEILVLPKKKKN